MVDHMVIDEETTIRGRGGQSHTQRNRNLDDNAAEPDRSEEGWVVIVRGIHEEADEDSLIERFAEFGQIKDVHFNLDRRTGYAKGYALIKYETRREAQLAVDDANNTKFLGQSIQVDFAFIKGPTSSSSRNVRRSNNAISKNHRGRSVSPA